MELFFTCLSQAVCLILPAAFMKITTSLLAPVQFLRRAVVCLPECLCERLEICLLVLVTKTLSPLLPPLSSLSLQHQHRREQGLGFTSVLLCQWNPRACGRDARRLGGKGSAWLVCSVRKRPLPAGAARSAASPGPVSDPKVSLRLLLVLGKTLVGKWLGATRWP